MLLKISSFDIMEFRTNIFYLFCRVAIIFLANGFYASPARAQQQIFPNKLSPILVNTAAYLDTVEKKLYRIQVQGRSTSSLQQLQPFKPQLLAVYDQVAFYMISATGKELFESVIPLDAVLFVEDGNRVAKEEVMVAGLDLSTNKINTVHRMFPQWNGGGTTVSVKENKPDTADIDFAGRWVPGPLSSAIVSSHATNMATMIAGGGNSWYTGKGAAWASLISSSDFANLLPDPLPVLQQNNITVQNHSYGVGIENFYGADAAQYDANMITDPVLMNIFSSGNSGTLASTTGSYAGMAGVANLTGSFKMAKNIITVGATDSFNNVAMQSSKGPAHDGRVKPELVAFGIDGSSGAAALVSGVSLMLQQQYKQMHGLNPNSALVKAVLLNSADDRGNKEVDYANGFGSLNALHAIRTLQAGRHFQGAISNGASQNFPITIPAGIQKIRITLVWNDPAATANASKALVNDLDLELLNLGTSETWKPWVLSRFPHIDSLKKTAVRKKDSLNNVEQVTLEMPSAGNYQLTVRGYSVTSASQSFYIAYQLDSSGIFEWHFPTAIDPVLPASVNTIRWNAGFNTAPGKLDYSVDNGNTWQLIDPAVDLAKGFYNWNTAATVSAALLKMTTGINSFTSDTFVIASRTQTGVGFNCPDSFLYYWNKLSNVNTYKLYKLGSRYLEPMLTTIDSFVVLQKNTNPSLHYAVAPLIGGREGVKSYTLNYELQGVDCYIRSFFAVLVNNNAEISLSLGSLYNINRIILEKFNGSHFVPIQQQINNTNLLVNFTDINLMKGLNIYRIKIELQGGGIVYTSEERVFYFHHGFYVVYPNPARQYADIFIAQEEVDRAIMQVFNAAGVKVFETTLDDRINKIPAGKLSKGIYFIHFTNNSQRRQTHKLVVY